MIGLTQEQKVNLKQKWNEEIKPIVKSYSYKIFSVSVSSLFYLLFLTLFDYQMTWFNFFVAVSLYFIIEDFKSYFIKFKK